MRFQKFSGLLLLAYMLALSLSKVHMAHADQEKATFAGGCFWCMEPPYDKLDGVEKTTSGYANGHVKNPTYKQVTAGGTGHYEAVQITYDPEKVSYRELLEVFWANIDPVDDGGQFCDRGNSYRPAVFYHDEEQKKLAETSRDRVEQRHELDGKMATPVTRLTAFYPAERYHQNYYQKNSARYKYYRWSCGRDKRLQKLWGERDRLQLF